jgi:hypothetical protein
MLPAVLCGVLLWVVGACIAGPSSLGYAGVSVSPMQQMIEVKPGQEEEFRITLNNVLRTQNQRPQTIRAEIVDFSVSLDGTNLFGEQYKEERSAAKWVTLDTNELTIKPGEVRELKGAISAPYRADGDYWCAIMLTQPPEERPGQIRVALRTASGIFVRVARRDYVERLSVENSRVSLPQFGIDPAVPDSQPAGGDTASATESSHGFEVTADVTNQGVIRFSAVGTAAVYSDSRRRVASIPMHSHRRSILPGHSRKFSGVMSDPLPAGKYVARTVFESDSEKGRKVTAEIPFEIGPDMAAQWAERKLLEKPLTLAVDPQNIHNSLTPGRFTTSCVSLSNNEASTLSVRCRFSSESPLKEWVEIKPDNLTLAPAGRRSLNCCVRIPKAAQPGDYEGTLLIESERAGLVDQNRTVELRIPVRITVIR